MANNGERVADFIFLGSKITADGDFSHEIKTLAPWKNQLKINVGMKGKVLIELT